MVNKSGWSAPIIDFIDLVQADKEELTERFTLYALGQFQQLTPILSGDLSRSFTARFSRNKLQGQATSGLPYAQAIWVEGHSKKLSKGSIDLIIANMQQLPIRL